MENMTIVQYLIKRINELGVEEFFGVPGDYNFNLIEEVGFNQNTRWVGCCNELNAAYAADGYARIKGYGAVITTFGVGELSAINAIAGAFAENIPVIKLVGLPKRKIFESNKIVHHCLKDAGDKIFFDMYSKVTGYSAILTTENAQEEIENALSIAFNEKKPIYLGLYDDLCLEPIKITCEKFSPYKSDENNLIAAVNHIQNILDEAKNPLIISEFPILRYGLEKEMQEFVDKSGFMATTLAMGKGSIDENSPNHIGLYCGELISEKISENVKSADLIIGFGVLMTDFNSGGFTDCIDFSKMIDIQADYVKINDAVYENVYIYDILPELNKKITKKEMFISDYEFGYESQPATNEELTQDYIYYIMQDFLDANDIFVAETALTSFGSLASKIPYGTKICTQSLWGSIGWGTPACLGACFADKEKRVILLTGEGSHQMTAQEISSMMRFGLNPIVIVVNNDGYTIERLLCEDPMDVYNDIPKWNYTKLIDAFDGKAITYQARTKKEFLDAISNARKSSDMVYIEAFTGIMDTPEIVRNLSDRFYPNAQKKSLT